MENRPIITCLRMRFVIGTVIGSANIDCTAILSHIIGVHLPVMRIAITGDKSYEHKAKASLRGCLNLFFIDGMASCAMVYPDTVNGKKAHYYDPWANDQDWALYYAVKWALDL